MGPATLNSTNFKIIEFFFIKIFLVLHFRIFFNLKTSRKFEDFFNKQILEHLKLQNRKL